MKFEKTTENNIKVISKRTGKSLILTGAKWNNEDVSNIKFIATLVFSGDKDKVNEVVEEFKKFQKQYIKKEE